MTSAIYINKINNFVCMHNSILYQVICKKLCKIYWSLYNIIAFVSGNLDSLTITMPLETRLVPKITHNHHTRLNHNGLKDGPYKKGFSQHTHTHQKQTAQELTNFGGFFAQGKRCLISRRLIVWERIRRHLSKQGREGDSCETVCMGVFLTCNILEHDQ